MTPLPNDCRRRLLVDLYTTTGIIMNAIVNSDYRKSIHSWCKCPMEIYDFAFWEIMR